MPSLRLTSFTARDLLEMANTAYHRDDSTWKLLVGHISRNKRWDAVSEVVLGKQYFSSTDRSSVEQLIIDANGPWMQEHLGRLWLAVSPNRVHIVVALSLGCIGISSTASNFVQYLTRHPRMAVPAGCVEGLCEELKGVASREKFVQKVIESRARVDGRLLPIVHAIKLVRSSWCRDWLLDHCALLLESDCTSRGPKWRDRVCMVACTLLAQGIAWHQAVDMICGACLIRRQLGWYLITIDRGGDLSEMRQDFSECIKRMKDAPSRLEQIKTIESLLEECGTDLPFPRNQLIESLKIAK